MIYIDLFHGRDNPDDDLSDWGFQGPILGPFLFCHITYGCHITLGDKDQIQPALSIDNNGLVEYLCSYYGDFSVYDQSTLDADKTLKDRWILTKKVMEMKGPAMGLLIRHKEQWVRNFFTYACDCSHD